MKFSVPRGTKDVTPQEASLYQKLEQKARRIFGTFNYKELRTPIFEDAGLFQRSLGQNTDIVQKQLLKLKTEGDVEYALRPEATASIVRAYIEHNIHKNQGFGKFFYIGPMFRGERPQKGRLREFNHIGAEAIGISNPYLDVEIISLAIKLLDKFGVNGYTLNINNLGCPKDKEKWSKLLRDSLKEKLGDFCSLCQDRFNRNVFRILDCKNEGCRNAIKSLRLKDNFICSECSDYFQKVIKGLDKLKIPYKLSPLLVRGLDYYTGTVFEITHTALGSQDAVGAGGRYDNLVKQLGGPQIGAMGFALGLERLILAISKDEEIITSVDVFLIAQDEKAYENLFLLLNELREAEISCDIDYEGASLKSQMRSANKNKAKFVIIAGEEELKTKTLSLKDMSSGNQEKIKSDQIINELKKRL